jgi:hypothetical protein
MNNVLYKHIYIGECISIIAANIGTTSLDFEE